MPDDFSASPGGISASPGGTRPVESPPWLAEVELTPADSERIQAWCRAVGGNPYGAGYQSCHEVVRSHADGLPPRLVAAVTRFGRRLGAAGALLVRGVPVPAELGPTPSQPYPQVRHQVGTESLLLAVAGFLGEVIAFADWHDGDRIQNMYPLPSEATRQNANNSSYLEIHTETAFRPGTPHALALLCLRPDTRADTIVGDLREVWAELDPVTRAGLARPAFTFRTPDGGLTEPKPVAAGLDRPAGPVFNYAEALCGTDPAHAEILDRFRCAVAARLRRLSLRPGDLLVLDNLHMVHGRTAFTPRYDGTDRWLQRCLVRSAAAGLPTWQPAAASDSHEHLASTL